MTSTTKVIGLFLILISTLGASRKNQETPAVAPRVQYNYSIVLKVLNNDQAADAIIAKTEAAGGYFLLRETTKLALKIPTAKAKATLAAIETLGIVVARDIAANDIGEEIEQLRVQLRSKEQFLQKYYAVMASTREDDVEEVRQEMSHLLSEIEDLQGTIKKKLHTLEHSDVTINFELTDRKAPVADGSSSFAWLNETNLSDVLATFDTSSIEKGRKGFSAAVPEGFAEYPGWFNRELRAVSPDGVVWRVRRVTNDQKADLAFWQEALKKRMLDAGYNLIKESAPKSTAGKVGYHLELVAPVGTRDFLYSIIIYVDSGDLIVAEAAGEVTLYKKHEVALQKAIEKTGG